MRTFEYAILFVLICGAVIYGASTVANAVSSSMNNSAAMIAAAGR